MPCKWIYVALTLLFSALPIAAAANPSIEETQAFIKERTSVIAEGDQKHFEYNVDFRVNCSLTVLTITTDTATQKEQYSWQSVDIKYLDPESVRTSEDSLAIPNGNIIGTTTDSELHVLDIRILEGRGNIDNMDEDELYEAVESVDDVDSIILYATDSDTPRIARAMRHLIKACGGKSPLF